MADAQRESRPRSGLPLTMGALVVVAGIGAAVFLIVHHVQERVRGTVSAEGTAVGSFGFTVDDCASGHAFVPGFFGVDLRGQGRSGGPGGFDLRVVDSGDDAQLWLYPPGAHRGAIPFSKADCARWDVLVEWAHVTVNRVNTVSGHLHATCAAGGETLAADVDFVRCAF